MPKSGHTSLSSFVSKLLAKEQFIPGFGNKYQANTQSKLGDREHPVLLTQVFPGVASAG